MHSTCPLLSVASSCTSTCTAAPYTANGISVYGCRFQTKAWIHRTARTSHVSRVSLYVTGSTRPSPYAYSTQPTELTKQYKAVQKRYIAVQSNKKRYKQYKALQSSKKQHVPRMSQGCPCMSLGQPGPAHTRTPPDPCCQLCHPSLPLPQNSKNLATQPCKTPNKETLS
jgi:hypothetical protein